MNPSAILALKKTSWTGRNIGQKKVSLVVVPALHFVWFIYVYYYDITLSDFSDIRYQPATH